MKKLEKEYADVRKKEQEEMGELRVSERCQLYIPQDPSNPFSIAAFAQRKSPTEKAKRTTRSREHRIGPSIGPRSSIACRRRGNGIRHSIGTAGAEKVTFGAIASTRKCQRRS